MKSKSQRLSLFVPEKDKKKGESTQQPKMVPVCLLCYAMLCHYTCWASNSWMIVKKKEEKKGPKIMSTVFHLTHFLFEHGLVYAPFLDKLIGFFFMTAETRSVVCLFSTYINNHLICYIESLWYFHALVKWSVWR